jgi:hypothetical protein
MAARQALMQVSPLAEVDSVRLLRIARRFRADYSVEYAALQQQAQFLVLSSQALQFRRHVLLQLRQRLRNCCKRDQLLHINQARSLQCLRRLCGCCGSGTAFGG